MDKIFGNINNDRAVLFAKLSLGIMFIWFGAMNFTSVGEGIISRWLESHMLLSSFSDKAGIISMAVGAFMIAIAGLILIFKGKLGELGAFGAAIFSFLALTLIIFANVWIESMGGFPVIGAGQGIIKYVSILGVALFLASSSTVQRKRALLVILFGIILVLVWIGGMKFTAIEAAGIKPLLETSPFFSWLLVLFGEQGASNFIGVVEIITALCLLGWFFSRTLFLMGAALCVVTFLGTLSFLITLPGWQETLGGFPALSGSGHFLLKDLVMLAGTFLLVANARN